MVGSDADQDIPPGCPLVHEDTGLLREIHSGLAVNTSVLKELQQHARTTNGKLADVVIEQTAIRRDQDTLKGAATALRWIFAATLAVITLGATIAGIVLTIVATGG